MTQLFQARRLDVGRQDEIVDGELVAGREGADDDFQVLVAREVKVGMVLERLSNIPNSVDAGNSVDKVAGVNGFAQMLRVFALLFLYTPRLADLCKVLRNLFFI